MRRRSNTRKCLLCLTNCASGFEDEEEDEQDNYGTNERLFGGLLQMAGAGQCNVLRQQLEKVFVLRKILDIPVSLCEKMLQNNAENVTKINSECDGDDNRNLVNWFVLCHHCMDTSVSEAWKVYQQITALELKMGNIKEQVKERMLNEINRPQNNSWPLLQKQRVERNANGGVEGEIINFLFPELEVTETQQSQHDVVDELYHDDAGMEEGVEMRMVVGIGISMDISNCSDNLSGEKDLSSSTSVFPRLIKRSMPSKKKRSSELARKLAKNRKSRSSGIWHSCRDVNCRARYRIAEDLEAHNRAHEEREQKQGAKTELDCPYCTFPARDNIELAMHIESRHKLQTRCYYFPCPKCNVKDKDFSTLKVHFDTEHPSNDQAQVASDQPQQCPVCPKRCESLKSFFVHQRSCHPEQVGMRVETLECNQCGIKFSTQRDLQSHVNRRHTQPKWQSKFVCEECGQGFRFQIDLNRHNIKHNTLKRNFVCHHCGLDYAYKWLLNDHFRKFHSGSTEQTQYMEGGSSATTATSATDKIVKTFNCKFCDFNCTIKGILIRHLEQHKQEKGFKCNECGKCYLNDAGLRRHVKIIHSTTNETFPCPHCLKPFKSLDYMKDHARVYCKVKKLQKEFASSVLDPVPEELAVESRI